MIEIQINEAESYSLPENWMEVFAQGKYIEVIKCLYNDHHSDETLRLSLFCALTGWDGLALGKTMKAWNKITRTKKAETMSVALAMQIKEHVLPALQFIFDDLFIECPIEQIKIRNIILLAPQSRLINQTGREMMLSHHAMVNFANDQKEAHLDRLISINYHQRLAGKRKDFSDEEYSYSLDAVKKIPLFEKLGIYHWICKCEEWYHRKYRYLYDEEETDPSKVMDIEENGNLWRKILLKFADNKMGHDYDAILNRTRQDIYFLMVQLEEERIHKEEAQSKLA